jgi:hypothetical protein
MWRKAVKPRLLVSVGAFVLVLVFGLGIVHQILFR